MTLVEAVAPEDLKASQVPVVGNISSCDETEGEQPLAEPSVLDGLGAAELEALGELVISYLESIKRGDVPDIPRATSVEVIISLMGDDPDFREPLSQILPAKVDQMAPSVGQVALT